MRKRIRKVENFIDGIYSGIPLCCNLSFCKGRNGIVASKELGDKYYQSEANYVQCKKCDKAKRIVQIKLNGRVFRG